MRAGHSSAAAAHQSSEDATAQRFPRHSLKGAAAGSSSTLDAAVGPRVPSAVRMQISARQRKGSGVSFEVAAPDTTFEELTRRRSDLVAAKAKNDQLRVAVKARIAVLHQELEALLLAKSYISPADPWASWPRASKQKNVSECLDDDDDIFDLPDVQTPTYSNSQVDSLLALWGSERRLEESSATAQDPFQLCLKEGRPTKRIRRCSVAQQRVNRKQDGSGELRTRSSRTCKQRSTVHEDVTEPARSSRRVERAPATQQSVFSPPPNSDSEALAIVRRVFPLHHSCFGSHARALPGSMWWTPAMDAALAARVSAAITSSVVSNHRASKNESDVRCFAELPPPEECRERASRLSPAQWNDIAIAVRESQQALDGRDDTWWGAQDRLSSMCCLQRWFNVIWPRYVRFSVSDASMSPSGAKKPWYAAGPMGNDNRLSAWAPKLQWADTEARLILHLLGTPRFQAKVSRHFFIAAAQSCGLRHRSPFEIGSFVMTVITPIPPFSTGTFAAGSLRLEFLRTCLAAHWQRVVGSSQSHGDASEEQQREPNDDEDEDDSADANAATAGGGAVGVSVASILSQAARARVPHICNDAMLREAMMLGEGTVEESVGAPEDTPPPSAISRSSSGPGGGSGSGIATLVASRYLDLLRSGPRPPNGDTAPSPDQIALWVSVVVRCAELANFCPPGVSGFPLGASAVRARCRSLLELEGRSRCRTDLQRGSTGLTFFEAVALLLAQKVLGSNFQWMSQWLFGREPLCDGITVDLLKQHSLNLQRRAETVFEAASHRQLGLPIESFHGNASSSTTQNGTSSFAPNAEGDHWTSEADARLRKWAAELRHNWEAVALCFDEAVVSATECRERWELLRHRPR